MSPSNALHLSKIAKSNDESFNYLLDSGDLLLGKHFKIFSTSNISDNSLHSFKKQLTKDSNLFSKKTEQSSGVRLQTFKKKVHFVNQ